MGVNNVISLEMIRKVKQMEKEDLAYQGRILSMSKPELLEEMVRFQEARSRMGHLTLSMMVQGKYLFKALEENAETRELRSLTRAYRRHLEYELEAYLKTKPGA